mmetsp:Transcript_76878/g.212437  ORF Transcript_76878/g.212437 Transcript_76878/m.212437 type:complete len:257 (+) Transcript_76878:91-861(+)
MNLPLLFVRACIVEALLEIALMTFLVWKLSVSGAWDHWGATYPFLTVFANVLRVWLAVALLDDVLSARNQRRGFRASSTRPCLLNLWFSCLITMGTWYFLAMVLARGPWVAWATTALTVVNIVLLYSSVWLVCRRPSAPESAGIAVKTFRSGSPADAESSLQFGECCAICLLDLEEGQLVGKLPCGHAFHEPCIRRWAAVKGCCPMRCEQPEPAGDEATGTAMPAGPREAGLPPARPAPEPSPAPAAEPQGGIVSV